MVDIIHTIMTIAITLLIIAITHLIIMTMIILLIITIIQVIIITITTIHHIIAIIVIKKINASLFLKNLGIFYENFYRISFADFVGN